MTEQEAKRHALGLMGAYLGGFIDSAQQMPQLEELACEVAQRIRAICSGLGWDWQAISCQVRRVYGSTPLVERILR